MKKFLAIYSILSILLSVSIFFACDGKEISFCHDKICKDESSKDDSSGCLVCTTLKLSLTPVYLGEIYFKLTHINSEKQILLPDRPPSLA
jgi:hypothetical protein